MKHLIFAQALFAILGISITFGEDNWNQFRGPTGRGHSSDKNVATKWSADSVQWSVDLPGVGQSSPVNWGEKVFLTSAEDNGKIRHVFCVDLSSGKELWKKTITCDTPEQSHKMNAHATPSCATDGERVYAFLGAGGLHCFDLNGKEIWNKPLGQFPGTWGVAASPILVGDMVVLNCDCTGPSRLVAFDGKTGAIRWETERIEKPRGGWSTPVLIDHQGKKEIVLNGEEAIRGYDPATGKELWFCKAFNGRGTPMPDFGNDTLFVINGKPGNFYAVKPGGSGDVTNSHMVWNQGKKGKRDLPSPAVVGNYMIALDMGGIASCFDAKTGKLLWNERLGVEGEFAASPLIANGLVYFINTFGGETVIIKPGSKLEVVSQNSIGAPGDEIFRATISPIRGKILIRSRTRLYCVEGS